MAFSQLPVFAQRGAQWSWGIHADLGWAMTCTPPQLQDFFGRYAEPALRRTVTAAKTLIRQQVMFQL